MALEGGADDQVEVVADQRHVGFDAEIAAPVVPVASKPTVEDINASAVKFTVRVAGPESKTPANRNQAAIRAISLLAASMAFSRCSAPSATPSARMKVTLVMPKKPNTPRR